MKKTCREKIVTITAKKPVSKKPKRSLVEQCRDAIESDLRKTLAKLPKCKTLKQFDALTFYSKRTNRLLNKLDFTG